MYANPIKRRIICPNRLRLEEEARQLEAIQFAREEEERQKQEEEKRRLLEVITIHSSFLRILFNEYIK